MTGLQSTAEALLQSRLRICLKVDIPQLLSPSRCESWVRVLSGDEGDGDGGSPIPHDLGQELGASLGHDERLFIGFIRVISRLLLELGRIPVFEIPQVVAIERGDTQDPRARVLWLDVVQIDNFPVAAYIKTFDLAVQSCRWMAEHPATRANRKRIFKALETQVVRAIGRLVPGGNSTIPLLRQAHAMGMPITHLGTGIYQLGWGSQARKIDRSTVERDSAMGARLAQNKVAGADLLRLAGLPAPVHAVAHTQAEALDTAGRLGFPLVVKPVDLDGGQGVTPGVSDTDSLGAAFARARRMTRSRQVIVERQVPGVCHRLFVANNRLLYAIKRLPVSILADGVRTLGQLLQDEVSAQESRPPWLRTGIKPPDASAVSVLEAAGFSLDSVPPQGMHVALRRIESIEWGRTPVDVTKSVHPDNQAAAIEAARLFGLHVAGIDMISTDISRPWHENGAIINEVNFAPVFGGTEISRHYIPDFLAEFMDGDGRIPIDFFHDEAAAAQRRTRYLEQGLRCFHVGPKITTDFLGQRICMPFDDVQRRLKALICRSDVDAIVLSA